MYGRQLLLSTTPSTLLGTDSYLISPQKVFFFVRKTAGEVSRYNKNKFTNKYTYGDFQVFRDMKLRETPHIKTDSVSNIIILKMAQIVRLLVATLSQWQFHRIKNTQKLSTLDINQHGGR